MNHPDVMYMVTSPLERNQDEYIICSIKQRNTNLPFSPQQPGSEHITPSHPYNPF